MIKRSLLMMCAAMISDTSAYAQSLETAFLMASARAPKLAHGAGVSRGDGSTEFWSTGPIHKNSAEQVGPNALWHIGSVTKSITATLVMRYAAKGDVALDAPIGSYLTHETPTLHPSWAAITLRQLLSHRSGLPANAAPEFFEIRAKQDLHAVRHKVLSASWVDELPGTPGDYVYSNLGYVLAGYVLETVIGQAWEKLIQTDIAAPLGLTSLGFGPPAGPDTPFGHQRRLLSRTPVGPDAPVADNPPWLGPAGTVHMSMQDLVAWGRIHLEICSGARPGFLPADHCLLTSMQPGEDYGLGWVQEDFANGQKAVWHDGSNTLWYAKLVVLPQSDFVIAAATNSFDARRIDRMLTKILQHHDQTSGEITTTR